MNAKASTTARLVGTVLGNYKIVSLIDEGGMGTIYKAEHVMIGKKVAIKVLRPEYADQPEIAERFFTEARAVNKIGHGNIVDISDYGFAQSGQPYFIMELLQGRPLSAILQEETRLPEGRALHIIRQIADALTASHRAGVVHRDLKPDNIMLVQVGGDPDFVKVLDFGIAKLIRERSLGATQVGKIIGTPFYMSPEQAEGHSLDHRSDLYSLGVILYEMLTGELPSRAKTASHVLTKIITEIPKPPREHNPDIPERLDAVIMRSLEKDPAHRYQSAEEFAQALPKPSELVAQPTPAPPPPVVVVPPAPEPIPANPPAPHSTRGVLGIVAAASVAVIAVLWLGGREKTSPALPLAALPTGPAEVTLSLHSTPEGAAVSLRGQSLCTTPCKIPVDVATEPATLRFVLDGYAPREQTVTLRESQSFLVELEPKPTASAPNPPPVMSQAAPAKAPVPAPVVAKTPSTGKTTPTKPTPTTTAKPTTGKGKPASLDGLIIQPKKKRP